MEKNISINQAKNLIKDELDRLNLSYIKLTARTIDFIDLARDKSLFIKVHGWKPNPLWSNLKQIAKDNNFFLESNI